MTPEHTIKQLRWRCRRGMRELDVLLTHYLDHLYLKASRDQQLAFQLLLEQEDDQLWDWLLGRSVPESLQLQNIVFDIGGQHAHDVPPSQRANVDE